MIQIAPSSLEVLDFQFKLQCRLKIFQNEDNSTFNKACNVVAAASKYGLLFIGTNSASFQVIQLQTLRKYNVKDGDITKYLRRIVSLPSKPQHLSVNCDCTKLSVVVKGDDCIKAIIYDIPSFLQQNIISSEIRLSPTPGVMATETVWNPTVPSVYTVCKDDGSLAVYDIKPTGIEINELPKTVGAMCICWSPKGKQIAVGSSDGKITQYKPDLKVAKIIEAPPLDGPHLPIALQWISNYQFIAIYKTTSPKDQCNLLVINCPKVGGVTYINYYDVCYSYGSARPYQFYMLLQHVWNILLVASSNSMEVGVLGFEKDAWTQWNLADSSRAELPLSSTKQDTFPVGLSLDVSSTEPIPWGEGTLPPAPLLLLLSDHGILSCFHAINLKEGAAQICRPPEVLPNCSTYFTEASPVTATTTPLPSKPVPINPVKQNVPPLNIPQPAATTFSFSFKQSANSTTSTANMFQQSATTQPFSLSSTAPPPTKVDKSSNQFAPSIFSTHLKMAAPTTTASETFTISADKPAALGNFSNRAHTPLPPMPEARTTSNNKHAAIARAPPKPELQEVPSANEDTESFIAQMVKEECVALESELKMLLSHGQNIKVDLGTDSEATAIVQNTNHLQEFIDEINEICQSQSVEVHHLKQELIQTWAWYEEANSRFNANKDPSLISLMRAQPLDAASARQLEDIRHMLYYLESQLKQANIALDEQWETFQDSCKKKLSLKLPSIETIYQSMVKQSATIQRQFYILKDISNRVKARARSSTVPHLLMSRADGDTLDEQLRNLTIQPKDFVHLQYERVLKRQNQLSTDKATKLRNFLKGRHVAHVSVNKPQLTNSSTRLIGLANAPFSPIVPSKKLQPQRLNFVQSTPKPPDNQLNSVELKKSQPQKLEPPINETNEVGNKEIGSAKVNDAKSNTFIFGGDAKSSSHGSAFVPTTQNVYGVKSSLFGDSADKTEAPPPQQKSIFSFNTPMSSAGIAASTSEPVQKPLFTSKPPNSPVVTTITSKFTFGSPSGNTALGFSFANKIENSSASSGATSNVKAFGSAAPNTNTFSTFKPLDNNSKSIFASPFPTLSAAVTKPATTAVFAPVVGGVKTSQVTSSTSDDSKTSASLFGSVTTTSTASSGSGNVSSLSVQILPTTKAIEVSKLATATSSASLAPVLSRIGASVTITPVMAPAKVETPPAESTATTGSSILNKAVIKSAPQIIAPVITIAQSKETTPEVGQSSVFSPVSVETPSNSTATTTTTPSVFSLPISTVSSTSSASSIFSAAAAPFVSTQQPFSFFGSTSEQATPSTAGHTWSIFGGGAASPFATTSQTTAPSTVSVTKTTVTTQGTVFSPASSISSPTGSNTTTPIIQPSLFGTSATVTTSTTTQSSVFGSTSVSGATTAPSIFGGGSVSSTTSSSTTQPSLFGSATVSTTQPPLFGSTTVSTTQSSLFGSTTVSTTQPSLFGSTTVSTTQPSLFGGATVSTTQPPLFGSTTVSTTQPSAFGSATVSTTQPSVFGSATVSTTQPSVFGTTTVSTTQASIFGGNTSTSQPSIFGSNTATTSQPSIFGGPAVTTGQSSIFGSPTASVTATTTQTTIYPPGTLTTSPAPAPAFGASPVFGAPTTQQPPAFGGLGTPSPSGGIFGTTTPAATDSVFPAINKSTVVGAFGTPSPTFSTTTASGPNFFAPSSSTAPSMFGQPPAFGTGSLFSNPPSSNTTGSVFGSSPPSAGNAFGAATPTTNTAFGSGFGSSTNTNASPFGSTTDSFRFATTTGPTTSGSFGFNKQAFSSFGNNSNTTDANSLSFGNMGLATSSPSNAFGSSAGFTQNPFGRSPSQEQQKSPFSGGSIFGASPATTSSPSSSIFGGSSPFSKTAPAFGGPATFGTGSAFGQQTPAFGQSAFGSSGSSVFGGTTQPGPFSRGAQPSVNQSGFGAAPVFGSAPAFASTSPGAFGAPPAFGAPSAFGMNSNFNTSSKPPFADAFGSSNQQNPTFANLANQTTLGFGNLAQQNQTSTSQSTFSGGSSFSNWR